MNSAPITKGEQQFHHHNQDKQEARFSQRLQWSSTYSDFCFELRTSGDETMVRSADFSLERFKWSLQALAAPAHVQLELYPDSDWKVDDMAIEFEEWYEAIKKRQTYFSAKQAAILRKLNKTLDDISGPENADYWMEEALRVHPVWEKIRSMAKDALLALGWPIEVPPKERSDFLVSHIVR